MIKNARKRKTAVWRCIFLTNLIVWAFPACLAGYFSLEIIFLR
jgi:hypothetical protein